MADLRVPSTIPPAGAAPVGRARVDAAREAQRAFFRAALDQQPAAAQAQPQPRAAASQPVAQAAPPQATAPQAPGQPQRLLRPGSFLDIKV